MKFPIKIIFDFDFDEYVVFVSGINGIEGRGKTEGEAIENFKLNYKNAMEG